MRSMLCTISARARILYVFVFVVIIGISSSPRYPTVLSDSASPTWHVLDIITPTLGNVEWVEKANYSKPVSWIADGRWYEAHRRQILLNSNDIFVSLSEALNWTALNNWFNSPYSSFDVFKNSITKDPTWWLSFAWNIDVKGYGVPINNTIVSVEFDQNTSKAKISIWCHITRIPEYILGQNQLETLLTGFDLTAVFIGDLEALQWNEDYTANGRSYYVYFKAPANLISQDKDMYSLLLDVSPLYQGTTYNVEQEIRIIMPSETDVMNANPTNMTVWNGNVATFTVHRGNRYPASYSVTSAPRQKSLPEKFIESVGTQPSSWVAVGTVGVLLYGTFRGTTLRRRRKTYYRLYRSMASVYDRYSPDPTQLNLEMTNLTGSILKYFIEDKMTDEQFEKLMTQRDYLLEQARKHQPSA
jgi:hypothetical protein